MAKAVLSSVFRQLLSARARGGPPDRHLLERFIAHKDEGAFAALVERHGAMVLAVAHNVLHHRQDAEDVFQATFLVLARRAASVRKQGSAGSWLHGVAYRLALKARTAAAARRRRERHAPTRTPDESPDDLTWGELSAILHAELEGLPDRYRSPLVLCYLEGMTQDQAAEHLGLARGTLRGRLERARLLLRGRLTRRGLAPAVVLLADTTRPAGAALSGPLVSTTARAAAAFAAGRAAGVSAPVAWMTKGALRAMFMTRLRSAALLLLTIGLVTAATGVLVARGTPDEPPGLARGTPGKPGPDGGREPPWSETVGGWRVRLTAPSGTEYHKNKPLPLSLELQNASGGPLSLGLLAPHADPEVTDDTGKRLVARPLIDVSPWEGRRDRLPAAASLKWTVDFDRLRFATQPVKRGTGLRVRFRLAMQGETPDGTQRLLFSNEVSLKLRDDHPSAVTGEADLPPKWTDSTVLVYREHQGLPGYDALRIDGEGHAALVTVGHGKGKPVGLVRTEAVLDREHLDRLAKFLRDQKLWEVADLSQAKMAAPDEGEVRFSFGAGHGSLVGSAPDRSVRGQRRLLALKAEMAKVMALVREGAAAKAPVEEPAWGTPLNGLRVGLCRTEAKAGGKVRLLVALDNVGADDLVLNLGSSYAKGKKHWLIAVRLRLTDGDGRERFLALKGAKRDDLADGPLVTPFVVQLVAGGRYTVASDLDDFYDPKDVGARLAPGQYRARAEFVGRALIRSKTDTAPLSLLERLTYWTGNIQSNDIPVTVTATPAR